MIPNIILKYFSSFLKKLLQVYVLLQLLNDILHELKIYLIISKLNFYPFSTLKYVKSTQIQCLQTSNIHGLLLVWHAFCMSDDERNHFQMCCCKMYSTEPNLILMTRKLSFSGVLFYSVVIISYL